MPGRAKHKPAPVKQSSVYKVPCMANHWRAAPGGYVLHQDRLSANLTFRGPMPGLRQVSPPCCDSSPRWPGPVLALRAVQVAGRRPFIVGSRASRPIHRLRTNVVDVQFEPSRQCPLRLHLYWSDSRNDQLDLEVLVSTLDPFQHLEVLTWSRVPRASVLLPWPGSGDGLQWLDIGSMPGLDTQWLILPRDREAAMFSLDGRPPGLGEMMLAKPYVHPLVLYRPTGQDWSYVEMSRVEDCARILARKTRGRAELSFGLFGRDTEKGVILRGRVRGVYIPRDQDTQRAREILEHFETEPPHLSV